MIPFHFLEKAGFGNLTPQLGFLFGMECWTSLLPWLQRAGPSSRYGNALVLHVQVTQVKYFTVSLCHLLHNASGKRGQKLREHNLPRGEK